MAKVVATLKDCKTGYTRDYHYEVPDEYASNQGFQWVENNYSCDCNRSLFLWDFDESKELECSFSDNAIELVRLTVDGKIIAEHNDYL